MTDLFPVTLAEQVAAAERELRMRRNVYPRRVADGKMSQKLADKETAAMAAIIDTLKGIKG